MENSIDINMLETVGTRGLGTELARNSHSSGNAVQSKRAAQACVACRKQKRKCDKSLPTCSLCLRMARMCDYSDATPTPNADDFAQLRRKLIELESRLDAKNHALGGSRAITNSINCLTSDASAGADEIPTFPSLFFLDSEIFCETRASIPRPAIPVSHEMTAVLGSVTDVRDVVERYFENIHSWLPIVSKKRMSLALENPNFELTADLGLLLLSMKLVAQRPHGGPREAQNQLYAAVKRQLIIVEAAALISLQMIQAAILVAVYEIGHAIYPAAYLTTGQCVRLGTLAGIHDRRAATQLLKRVASWAELEEAKRSWWACMLLDRYVVLGTEGRPSTTGDPGLSTVLPADDQAWDEGELTASEPLYVSTATSVKAGAFARTCQATHLLGRLSRLLNDGFGESPLRFTEAAQLYRTLEALANLIPEDNQKPPRQWSTPLALCHGAIIHLCDPYCCTDSNKGNHTLEETEMQQIAINGMKRSAQEVVKLSRVLRNIMQNDLAAISPLTADALYMAATTYAWLVHETGSPDHAADYHYLYKVLVHMNQRWAVAGEYLKALDITKTMLYDRNPAL